jgi:hypothetical protein
MREGSVLKAETPAIDLVIAEAMTAELENYIVADEVYRTVIVRTPEGDQNLRMSGGDLLARFHRLHNETEALTPGERQRLDAAQQRADATIYSLKTRFHQRLQREMKARLDSLRWYLDELGEDKQAAAGNFPFEMRNRQRIEEIVKRLGNDVPEELKTQLLQTDRRIRQVGRSAGFTWDPRVQHIYPQETYWYLYMRP